MSTIEVSVVPAERLEQVNPWLAASHTKPQRFLLARHLRHRDLEERINTLWLRELKAVAEGEHGEVFVARAEGEVLGFLVCCDLSWETKVIGNKMAAVKYIIADPGSPRWSEVAGQLLDRVTEWAASRGVELLTCKTYSDDVTLIHTLEERGFLLMDTLLDFVYNSEKYRLDSLPRPRIGEDCTIRLADMDDVKELMSMARFAFQGHMGRFHSDARISRPRATRVYEEWMRASCEGYADWVLVAQVGGRIAGTSIWRRPSSQERELEIPIGHYSIGVVHPDFHGKGLFSALTYAGMELFSGVADYIEGPTHINNYAVQIAYIKLGWRVCDARHAFHKWLVR